MNAVYFVIAFSTAQVKSLPPPIFQFYVPTYETIGLACAAAERNGGEVFKSSAVGTRECVSGGKESFCRGTWTGLRRVFCKRKEVWIEIED
jgi:hypothetical protein